MGKLWVVVVERWGKYPVVAENEQEALNKVHSYLCSIFGGEEFDPPLEMNVRPR